MTNTREPTGDEHAAITNLLAHYCLSLDHDDVDTWVSLFTEDGQFDVYGRSFDGREGLRKMMAAAPKGLHLGGPPLIRMHDADKRRPSRTSCSSTARAATPAARSTGMMWFGPRRDGRSARDPAGSSCPTASATDLWTEGPAQST